MSTDPAIMAGEINDLEAMVELRDRRIRQLERLNTSLAAEIDNQRAWKESAMTLLSQYDNIADTFGGKLGSSKITNLETGVAALRAEINRMRPVVERARCVVLSNGSPARLIELSETVGAYEASQPK